MHSHIVKSYEAELAMLETKVGAMGGQAEQLLGEAFQALEQRNPEQAQTVIDRDDAIDQLQRELEEQVINMIARRQPLANDLRQIMAVLKIAGDLERIGDLAKNIGKRALAISGENRPKALITGLRHMVDLTARGLKDVLDAFTARDADKALQVWRDDEHVDDLYNSIFRELLTYMMEDPRNIGLCTHLLFGAKNIERIGDHTTNIAETVYYLARGVPLTEERPKNDKTSSILIHKAG